MQVLESVAQRRIQNWWWSWRQCSQREARARLLRKVLEVHALLLPVSAGVVSAGAAALSSRRRRVSERAPVQALQGITPTPGIGTGTSPNITPTPGIGTTPNPGGTLTGGAPSSGPPGERSSSDKPSSDKPPNLGPARTLADIKEETEPGITYQPCPANVRFPNGQQMCLGLPGFPSYRPSAPPKQR